MHTYERLARLCEYPTRELGAALERCRAALSPHLEAAALLEEFATDIARRPASAIEELYALTFDLKPERCLDLGYQVFGETYKRGAFLVKMKEAVVARGIDPGVELHDHLPVVLRLLARLGPADHPEDLASEVVLPSVEKILRTFSEHDGGYRLVLEAVKRVLMADYGITQVEPAPDDPTVARDRGGRRLPVFPGFEERRAS